MKSSFRKSIIVYLLLLCSPALFSQVTYKKEFIKSVQEADAFFYYDEDFEKAASLYELLLNQYPDSYNLAAKLGICYLSLDGKKTKALKLLAKASLKVVGSDREYVEYGEKAPLDTYLYLAIAYHQNDSLQKAISLYSDAKKRFVKSELFRKEYFDKQISDCKYAIEMEKNPQSVITSLFIPWLTDYPGAGYPVISKNDSVFVFTMQKEGKSHIFCSQKSDVWNRPLDITKQLGGNDKLFSNSMTMEGNILIIYMEEGGDGNLYFSERKGTSWTKIKSVGKSINTNFWESHGFITPDGKTLYFASNRPGGFGELDLWVSEKDNNGSWKAPKNCGNVVNTPYNENTPFYDPASKTLFFSSAGHSSMGGYDVFQSVNKYGRWTNPIGLPYSINNTTENTFFILDNNSGGFITSLFNETNGLRNIYSLNATVATDKPIRTQGTISLQDGMPVNVDQSLIRLSDQKTGFSKVIPLNDTGSYKFELNPGDLRLLISHIGSKSDTINVKIKTDTLVKNKSLVDTGTFKFEVKPGDYQLLVGHPGYKTDTINLDLAKNLSGGYVSVTASLVPDKVYMGDFLTIKNILFEFNSYKLNDQAVSVLESLKSILKNYPELKIEVAGYTDVIGSTQYNIKLADNRAQEVIGYLSESGVSLQRFTKRAYGASDFAAINTNPDGTDNPEGRKYNRRVTIGIVDPQTGIIIRSETYTPEHLRQPNQVKSKLLTNKTANYSQFSGKKVYTIQLSASLKPLDMNLFKDIEGVREVASLDGYYRYLIGEYTTFSKAKAALTPIQESGFKSAFIRELNAINIK